MATIAATEVQAGGSNSPKVYKFPAFNMKTVGELTAAIDADGYSYAVIYAVAATVTSGSGTGNIIIQAGAPDGTTFGDCRATYTSAGVSNHQIVIKTTAAAPTTGSAYVGQTVENLPSSMRLFGDGGNAASTAYTIDIYIELHQ